MTLIVHAFGCGLPKQSRYKSGSFHPGKADAIPARIHPPMRHPITAEGLTKDPVQIAAHVPRLSC